MADGLTESRTSLAKIAIFCTVAGAVLLSAACGGSSGQNGTGDPSPTLAASPTPTVQVASVQQYAGLVNAEITDMRKTWENWERTGCFFEVAEMPCPLITLTLEINAQKIGIVLEGAAKPGVPAFIGVPPPEIAQLVTETRSAAQRVDDAIDDPAEVEPAAVDFAMIDLLRQFDRWAPYI